MASSGAVVVVVYLLLLTCCVMGAVAVAEDSHTENPQNNDVSTTSVPSALRIPSSCSLVMAQSSIANAGWGVFSLTDRAAGEAALDGDLVIQVSDLNTTFDSLWRITFDYAWDSQETGGQYEGIASVMSVIPGLGMLANGSPRDYNLLPVLEPRKDEAGVTRHNSAGAGAFTHYHNYTFVLTKPLSAGSELMANYGPNWFQKRADLLPEEVQAAKSKRKLRRSTTELLQEGFCLDNLQSGTSTLPHAGRGAFARRKLSKGSIVAPVPVLPITNRNALDVTRVQQRSPTNSKVVTTHNLLLNYCYGHQNSSILLFPYSPMVNLINHSPHNEAANVQLQWSNFNQQHQKLTLDQLHQINTNSASSTGSLLLELVALRDIQPGEEILMDYGSDWQRAWNQHLEQWKPYASSYVPSHVMDNAVSILATQEELDKDNGKRGGYPANIITSCFYKYQTDTKNNNNKNIPSPSSKDISTEAWTYFKGIYELRHLRPCNVMKRFFQGGDPHDKNNYLYTVMIRNRHGLTPTERIPTEQMHIVTQVSRRAIRFSDKIYTTDQHLEGAFRHDIRLADEIFPPQWMDLRDDKE